MKQRLIGLWVNIREEITELALFRRSTHKKAGIKLEKHAKYEDYKEDLRTKVTVPVEVRGWQQNHRTPSEPKGWGPGGFQPLTLPAPGGVVVYPFWGSLINEYLCERINSHLPSGPAAVASCGRSIKVIKYVRHKKRWWWTVRHPATTKSAIRFWI